MFRFLAFYMSFFDVITVEKESTPIYYMHTFVLMSLCILTEMHISLLKREFTNIQLQKNSSKSSIRGINRFDFGVISLFTHA